jgi:plasmid stabilization system protein ParE
MHRRASVLVSRAADQQIAEVERWWKENGLASDAIHNEIKRFSDLLEVNPYLGNAVENARRPGLRHFYLERIRRHVFYRVDEHNARVVIVALRHERTPPGRPKQR